MRRHHHFEKHINPDRDWNNQTMNIKNSKGRNFFYGSGKVILGKIHDGQNSKYSEGGLIASEIDKNLYPFDKK